MSEIAPEQHYEFRKGAGDVLVIACGALARELVALVEMNGWRQFDIQCLPAIWHNSIKAITMPISLKSIQPVFFRIIYKKAR